MSDPMNEILTNSPALKDLIIKAETLMEALPYIKRFRGQTVVIKYGGHAMINPLLKQCIIQDVVMLEHIGVRPIIVHGGGPEISKLMDRVGRVPELVEGQRVTDAATMDIAEMALAGKINGEIVSQLNQAGGRAVGLSGKDACMILAHKLTAKNGQDIGFVGEVESINCEILEVLDANGFIPVISPIGVDAQGQTYNINADSVASEVAKALKAKKLVLLTDVRGVCRDPKEASTLIHKIARSEIEPMIEEGIVSGGMIPKLRACGEALKAGVGMIHILDGRLPHALLLELFTDQGVGTMIVQNEESRSI